MKRLQDAVEALMKSKNRHEKYNFTNHYQITQAQVVPMQLDPNPTDILHSICSQLLVKNVSTILYMTNSEIWGSNAASAQYVLQLTSYLGIPVIAWNADNIGLDQVRITVLVYLLVYHSVCVCPKAKCPFSHLATGPLDGPPGAGNVEYSSALLVAHFRHRHQQDWRL